RWCQRVGGRPKIVKTAYLGPLENIVQAVETAQQPLPPHTAEVSHFADVAALYDQAVQIGLIELIDAQVPKREQGLSVGQYLKLDLRTLVYDGSNSFTYNNTRNPATLPARGHNKQKRTDLRQVNLGLLVSTDFHVPLMHKVYTGNLTDATAFQTISEELAQ